MRAGYGVLVWAVLPFVASLLVVAVDLLRPQPGRAGATAVGTGLGGPKARPGWCIVLFLWRTVAENGTIREALEAKVGELEKLADSLTRYPTKIWSGLSDEAVELLAEINTRIESRLDAAGEESREIGDLLGRVDFGPFDEALEELRGQGTHHR